MKKFKIYKNIRKRAMIMGLPISLFGLMMASVIGSLMLIIFSFSLSVIILVLLFNFGLYLGLSYSIKNPNLLHYQKVFPDTISNKKAFLLPPEENPNHHEEN